MIYNQYSVLMSVYAKERPEYLKQSVESVMRQTVLPNDFVLMCDGPLTKELDGTIELLKQKYNILNVVRLEVNGGLGNALSIGINHTKNEIIMRMDSDDICLPNRAELELPLMDKYDLVGGFISEFEDDPNNIIGIREVPEKLDEIKKFAKKRNPFNHPTVMFKKQAIFDSGNYQPLAYLEDYYLWVRFLLSGKTAYNVQSVLVNMRSGATMRARRSKKEAKKSIKVLRKYMYKNKMIGWGSYIFGTWLQLFVLSLPLKIKSRIYSKVLRKQNKKS